jgi:hypothetical protein
MITIKCPKCGADSKLSLVQPIYVGPHKCWKCRELYNIRIENNVVKSCEPMTPEELERHQQLEEARNKKRS